MAWEHDFVKAVRKQNAPSPFRKNFYTAVYANGDFMLFGGSLRFGPKQQVWTHEARYYHQLEETEHMSSAGIYYTYRLLEKARSWENGMKAAVMLNENDNEILIIDVIGKAGEILNVKA